MKRRKTGKYLIWLLALLVLAGVTFNIAQASPAKGVKQTAESGSLTIHFLDVGQGNAVLAESEGHYMLVDGGVNESSSFVVSYLKKQGVKKLDYIVVSHYDADHLAGVVGALHAFDVGKVISPDYEGDTKLFASYEKAVKDSKTKEIHPKTGDEYELGSSDFTVVGPENYDYEDENDNSVSIRVENGENSFLFCGDAQEEAEKDMLKGKETLQSDVYLVNHHGSHSSTTEDFLEEVDPDYAVISCGKDNSYGHPHQEVMERLKEEKVSLYRTDLQGTITAKSDGKKITWGTKPCNDFTPGEGTSEKKAAAAGDKGKATVKKAPVAKSSTSQSYVLNTNTKKFHMPSCASVDDMKDKNKENFTGTREDAISKGYTPCKRCNP